MDILIVGTGYVGLVSGAAFAEMGHQVTCLDINEEKITQLKSNHIPIYEPGLEELVKRNSKARRLKFTTSYKDAVPQASICFLAVDTPVSPDGSANLNSITKAAESIAQYLKLYTVIVNKSTVPVGTAEHVRKTIQEILDKRGVKIEFDVVSNPEFLKEGAAINDFMRPDRVIIGTNSDRALERMREVYKPFMLSSERLYFMDIASAELTKYAANAMLATRISFMNWLSELAEKTGADITEIRKGIGSDKRIGLAFLWAGCGFGGSCFPKDLRALQSMCQNEEIDSSLLDAVLAINAHQKELLFTKISEYYELRGGIEKKTFGILGLSFKPDTDDMREAPSLTLIHALLKEGAYLRLYDPVAMNNAKKILGNHPKITWCDNEQEIAKNAHAIVLVTEWKQFRLLDFDELKELMQSLPVVFDGRNQYNAEEMISKGIDYISIGRKSAYATTATEALSNVR